MVDFAAIAERPAAVEEPLLDFARCRQMINEPGGFEDPRFLRSLDHWARSRPADPEILHLQTYAAWIRDQRHPERTLALELGRRLATLLPRNASALRMLGAVALSKHGWLEAYLAFAGAAFADPPLICQAELRLALVLMQGKDQVSFRFGGETYGFPLSVHTTQAYESSMVHCSDKLTEAEELSYIEQLVPQGCSLVEVGVLLGNHTAFFQKRLRPAQLVLVEADPACLPLIQRTVALNNVGTADIYLHHAFVGRAGGTASMGDVSFETKALDELVAGSADFIKIDVDGAELDALAGAERLLSTGDPVLMIEVRNTTAAIVDSWLEARGFALVRRFEHGSYANCVYRRRR